MAKPLFPWMGNKEKLAPHIQKMIPPGLTQFAEIFGIEVDLDALLMEAQ